MTAGDTFGGMLWLRPGQPRPHNLRSTRPDWVGRLTRGLPARRLSATLASLFSLCSHAHRLCADLAVSVALGHVEPLAPDRRADLARQTLCEHLRRIWLDWPQRLGDAAAPVTTVEAATRELAGALSDAQARAPTFATAPSEAAGWLQAHAIGTPLADWLQAWDSDPAGWLQAWSERTDTLPARLLQACRPFADTALPSAPPLRMHADAHDLRTWAGRLRETRSDTTRQPRWQGACAETGVWTRLHDRTARPIDTPWLRLGARLAECVRLAMPAAATADPAERASAWLDLGALHLAPGEAVAWVEMARGLLIHHVHLDSESEGARVLACHVVAPTEWNFHPDGAVARALETLPPVRDGDSRRRLDALLTAYDPCVPFTQDQAMPDEVAHA